MGALLGWALKEVTRATRGPDDGCSDNWLHTSTLTLFLQLILQFSSANNFEHDLPKAKSRAGAGKGRV
jgi:hypothetical protein